MKVDILDKLVKKVSKETGITSSPEMTKIVKSVLSSTTPIGQLPSNELIGSVSGNLRIAPASGILDLQNSVLTNADISGSSSGTVQRSFAIQNTTQTLTNSAASKRMVTGTAIGNFTPVANAFNVAYKGARIRTNGTIQIASTSTFHISINIGGTAINGYTTPAVSLSSVTPFSGEFIWTCLTEDTGSGGLLNAYFNFIIYSTPILVLGNNSSLTTSLQTPGTLSFNFLFSVANANNTATLINCMAEYF